MTRAAFTDEDDIPTLAELCIRRLANRHGHRRTAYAGGLVFDNCPDPQAHARDVADMSTVLEAIGAVPYDRAAGRYHYGQPETS